MFCRKCGCEKVLGERCKQCAKIYHKDYRQNNKEKLNEQFCYGIMITKV